MTVSGYLDHNATTPLDERVLEAMLPYLKGEYGNPSSAHRWGRLARAAVEQARELVATLAGAHPNQVIFTGGGSEANNLALKGVAAVSDVGRLAVSVVEHASVLEPARTLARHGWTLDYIPVDNRGRVTAEGGLREALARRPKLISVMSANNETGVIQDIPALAALARSAGAIMHTDAVQAAGKLSLDFTTSGVQLMTLSAHKLYGPKGIGALIHDRALELEPLVDGGGQEWGLRGGTENVAGIVGFGRAAELAVTESESRRSRLLALRQYLEARLAALPCVVIIAQDADRLANTVMLGVPGMDGETLLLALDQAGIAVSSGSACRTGSTEASHVLTAMGVVQDIGRAVIRVSLGKDNTETDVDRLVIELGMLFTRRSGVLAGWG